MRRIQAEFAYYITPDGVKYHFQNGVDKFLVSFSGDGMPPIEYTTQQGPGQHGETVLDYRLQSRVVQLLHRRNACDRQGYWENRAALIDLLRPNRQSLGNLQPGVLGRALPGGYVRHLNCFIQEGPEFQARDTESWDEVSYMETLRFIAHDPVYFDPTQVCLTWTLTSFNQLVFPFTFPFILGTTLIDNDITVTYTGNWLSFPTIQITGPIYNPIITNESTGEFIKLNLMVLAGEVVTISLAYGNKQASSSTRGIINGAISEDSDLMTFHIAPSPEVSGGINTIKVVGTGAVPGTTLIQLAYYTRYLGI